MQIPNFFDLVQLYLCPTCIALPALIFKFDRVYPISMLFDQTGIANIHIMHEYIGPVWGIWKH